MPCSVRTTGSGVPAGIVTPNAVIHYEEGETCNSDPNQSVSFHLFQCAGRPVPSLLDFGRHQPKEASVEVALLCRLSELERRLTELGLLSIFAALIRGPRLK